MQPHQSDTRIDTDMLRAVYTAAEQCRVCYTCVRECPAKAIRILEGQAEIVAQRCIGCGNCVRVCSQGAKQIVPDTEAVYELLEANTPVVAMVAPSFPVEFDGGSYPYQRFVGMLRALGFSHVHEVAFGADLVAQEHKRIFHLHQKSLIATSCPAVVYFVEKYYPELVDSLAPIASPMVATARVVRHVYGADVKTVFIGPCTSKKLEATDEDLAGEVDAVLTFVELQQMFDASGLDFNEVPDYDFDPPHASGGSLFPLWGGMLQAAEIQEDLVENEVLSAHGKSFTTAIKEFAAGNLQVRLLDLLACDGCIMGAGTQTDAPVFRRREHVSSYVRAHVRSRDAAQRRKDFARFSSLDLTRGFRARDQRIFAPHNEQITEILARLGKHKPEDELNCGACGYETCCDHALAIYKGLAESEMCLPYTIDKLNETVTKLAASNRELKSMQEALMQSERLASMGQLAAGVAHEVNNPLGVVIMYSHLLLEKLEETGFKEDAQTIAQEADRCKKIVSGLLNFARQRRVNRKETDIEELIQRSIRDVIKPDTIKTEVRHEIDTRALYVDGDQLQQVLTNLISNAYAAMPESGTLTIATRETARFLQIMVQDTGTGMDEETRKKIFEPFFTTKKMGKGTGLGLAVAYGIIKMHSGTIEVESNNDTTQTTTGTTFTINLPKDAKG